METKLLPSDILINADESKHIINKYVLHWNYDTRVAEGYCALGLLGCKTHVITNDNLCPKLEEIFSAVGLAPVDAYRYVHCPICNYTEYLEHVIIHINDVHEWTFKDIGLWLKIVGY